MTTTIAPTSGRFARVWARSNRSIGSRLFALALLALLAVLVVMPLYWLVYASFRTRSPVYPGTSWTVAHWTGLIDEEFLHALFNTVVFASVVAVVSVAVAALLAWVVVRTDAPLRRVIEVINVLPFVMSPFVLALGWMALLSPRSGLINYFVLEPTIGITINIFSWWAIVAVTASFTVPTAYLFLASALRSMDTSLEEASRMAGGGLFTTLRKVTLPVMLPALASASLVSFVLAAETFTIPAILGRPINYTNLATLIYQRLDSTPSDWAGAAAAGSVLLLFAGVGTWLNQRLLKRSSRFVTVTGKMRHAEPIRLGKWRRTVAGAALAYGFVAVVLPVGAVIFAGLLKTRDPKRLGWSAITSENYRFLTSPQATDAVKNTIVLAIGTPIAIIALSALLVYVVRRGRRSKLSGVIDTLSTLPLGLPGLVLGVALLWSYFRVTWLPVYGTILLLLIGYVTKYLPYGYRNLIASGAQVHDELSEASRMAGAGPLTTYRRVMVPLMRPTVVYTFVLLFVLISRETTVALVLSASGVLAIAPVVWRLINAGSLGSAYTLSLVQIAMSTVAIIVAQRAFNARVGPSRGRSS